MTTNVLYAEVEGIFRTFLGKGQETFQNKQTNTRTNQCVSVKRFTINI